MRKRFFVSHPRGSDEPTAGNPVHLYTYGEISEEVKDIVGKRPVWIVRFGSAIFLSIILLLLILAMRLEFPQKLTNKLVVGSLDANVFIKAGAVGRVARLFVHNNQYVGENEVIGYLDSASDYATMLELDSLLDLAGRYAVDGPSERLKSLITSLQDLGSAGCDHDVAAVLTGYIRWSGSLPRDNGEAHAAFLNSLELCKEDVREWKRRFLLASPVAGEARYVDLKVEGQIVTKGEDLFYIAQPGSPLYGEMRVPQTDLPFYKKGETVTVKIDGFSTGTTGDIAGIVEDFHADPDKSGSFVVRVALPGPAAGDRRSGLCTGMSGQASLILRKESLLMVLFHRMLPQEARDH